MAYDSLVIDELKKYSKLGKVDIISALDEIAKIEYMNWLNSNLNISRIRDLHVWRFSQLMERIFKFKVPTEESLAFIFQITLSSARSLIKDYRAQYGRKGFITNLRAEVADILEAKLSDARAHSLVLFKVAFQNNPQIDELFEAVRRVAENDPTIEEPKKVPGKIYVIEISDATADKAIIELRK